MGLRRIVPVLILIATLTGACSGGGSNGGGGTTPPSVPASTGSPGAVVTSPGASPAAGTVAGDWNGTWQSTVVTQATGTFTVTFAQNGNALTGTVRVADSTCLPEGSLTGVLNGSAITFGAVKGANTISYTGTVSGDSMSGTYGAPTCGPDQGTWEATRA
jgi:hypothetical protein